MKNLFPFLLLAFIAFPYANLTAQDDYKKLMQLSYAEIDSLMMVAYSKGIFDKAIPYMQAGREKAKVEFGEQDSVFASYTSNLGFFHNLLGQYGQAESLYLQLIAIDKKALGELHPDYATSLNNFALLYQNMGNYTKAEPLFLQAIAIKEKALGELHPDYAASLGNLAVLYKNMGNYTKAEPLFLQTMTIRKEALGELHPNYATSLNNLAVLYEKTGNYTKAEPLYLQAMAIRKKTLGELHPNYANSLNNLALLYKSMGNYTKAEPLYLQAIAIRKKALGELHPNYANSLNNLAFLYQNMEKLDSAFYYCRLGILANAAAIDSSFADWENLDTFNYTSNNQINLSIHNLLSILQKQYDQSKDQNKLETHYTVSQAAIRLNERIRGGFTAEGDKLRILAENNRFVLAAIKTGLELKKADYEATTFGFAEMNKGVLLLEAAQTANAQQFGNLPDTLAEQEAALQKKQSHLTAKLLENRAETEKDSLRRVLNATNQEIDDFTKMLKDKYPKYAALKYHNKTANAKEVQALLDDKTALLEYMIGDSVVYIFYVDKKQVKLTPIYLSNKSLNEKIKNLHTALSNYKLIQNNPNKSYTDFTENAHWFYENLIAPALKNAKSIEQLIIIPDGELAHLPFETFLVEKTAENQPYSDFHYLMKDYKISYNYSATLWKENRESPQKKNNGQLLAMAAHYTGKMDSLRSGLRLPVYNRLRQILNDLPEARKEVESLQKSFSGFFGFDNNASETVFKEKAGEYAIIHLAMHGLLDEKHPILSSLAFTEDGDSVENNFLQAYEISKMELNADLVVLSACETGFGKFEKGNGTASLARAFMYAGASALVVSLWQVNDASTSAIMQLFYTNLSKGMPKDEALQQAKLDYIKNADGLAAHPAFWSPFILIGDNTPVKITKVGLFHTTPLLWWAIGGAGLLVVGIAVFVLRKRKKEA